MIAALETAGFFLLITAVLQFSSWAEVWLKRPAETTLSVDLPERTVRAA